MSEQIAEILNQLRHAGENYPSIGDKFKTPVEPPRSVEDVHEWVFRFANRVVELAEIEAERRGAERMRTACLDIIRDKNIDTWAKAERSILAIPAEPKPAAQLLAEVARCRRS